MTQKSDHLILVVDDEAHMRTLVSRWLEGAGYRCRVARDVSEAHQVVQTEKPALILADLMMPGTSGLDLLKKVQKDHSEVGVLMMTAMDDQEIALRAVELGAFGYLVKPFEENELLINVATALQRREMALAYQTYQKHLEEEIRAKTEEIRQLRERAAQPASGPDSRAALEKLKRELEQSRQVAGSAQKPPPRGLDPTMDPAVAQLAGENRLYTDKRQVSVLFCDLKDFSLFSARRKPELVITDLNRLMERMESVLHDYHGHLDKYLGDGLMAEFGVPQDHERHALLSAVAGLKMQQRIREGKFPWQMRVGIATGEVIMGLIGHRRQSYTAIGDVVNFASRIQGRCPPGSVTVDASTFEGIRRFVESREKTILLVNPEEDPDLMIRMTRYLRQLDEDPENIELVKKVGLLFSQTANFAAAHEYLGRALHLDPKDQKIKLAFAETGLKMRQSEGARNPSSQDQCHIYEIIGLRNPLLDRDKISESLYQEYYRKVEEAFSYPEDLLLPVEAMDGSIGHSRVVGFLAYVLADAMVLKEEEKRTVLEAGYLADIGKAKIDPHLLNRAGGLNPEEFQEIARHSEASLALLEQRYADDPEVLQIIAASHESFNGSGYPGQLSGEKIPLGARIVAVADTYDGLTSWRPYRDRWDARAALTEMRRETEQGKFDPKVMETFEQLMNG